MPLPNLRQEHYRIEKTDNHTRYYILMFIKNHAFDKKAKNFTHLKGTHLGPGAGAGAASGACR
jgi:hypothetical protein